MPASPELEAARFARQVAIPGLGEAGQARLRAARVHVVGAGPVSGPALLALAQAGVGTLLLDDGEDVGSHDGRTWLCRPSQAGEPRVLAARQALLAATSLTAVRFHATGARPTAVLVCADSSGSAARAADLPRTAGLPHVAVVATSDGGEVISVPVGAPCVRCATRPSSAAQARGGMAAAMGSLAALELILLLTGLVPGGSSGGRRVSLEAGVPSAAATARRAGCDCAVVY